MKRFLQLSVLLLVSAFATNVFAQHDTLHITLNNFYFGYDTVKAHKLTVGDTIVWTGKFQNHPLKSKTIPDGAAPFEFNSSSPGIFKYEILVPGEYSFICENHDQTEGMNGSFSATPSIVRNETSATGIKLEQNYPNPVSSETNVGFSLEKATDVTLSLYTSTGEFVKSLASGTFDGGKQSVTVDASTLANGVYFYRLSANGETLAGQMVVAK